MTIVCDTAGGAGELVIGLGRDVATAANLRAVPRMLQADPAEDLVVVGPEVPLEDALGFSAWLRTTRPAAGVVLVRRGLDVDVLTRALQAGVRDVVPAGDAAALAAACGRSRQVSAQFPRADGDEPTREGKVVTVFSPKGGVGKTTLAVNLAVALAGSCGQRVCAVDLDLAFGDVAISTQLDPVRTTVEGLRMAGQLDPTGATSLLTPYRPGLDMLLAPTAPGDAEKISPALVGELLAVLRGMYDVVVVDTPAALSEHVLTAMDASAHHVLLTTPDVPALKSLRVTLDMLDLLSYPREIRSVVLNRADAKVGLEPDDIEKAVRTPIAAHVPSSRAVPISINRGEPLAVAEPGHPVSQAILRFARAHLVTGPVAAPARSRVGRLRRRAA